MNKNENGLAPSLIKTGNIIRLFINQQIPGLVISGYKRSFSFHNQV
jgi:hypothetical protein